MGQHDSLNKRAADSFERLREQQGWTKKAIAQLKEEGWNKPVDIDKVKKLLDKDAPRVEIKDKVHHINDRTDSALISPIAFLDSLALPPKLTIAIANLISTNVIPKDKDRLIKEAIELLNEELKNG